MSTRLFLLFTVCSALLCAGCRTTAPTSARLDGRWESVRIEGPLGHSLAKSVLVVRTDGTTTSTDTMTDSKGGETFTIDARYEVDGDTITLKGPKGTKVLHYSLVGDELTFRRGPSTMVFRRAASR
jgi:hypothetical protein